MFINRVGLRKKMTAILLVGFIVPILILSVFMLGRLRVLVESEKLNLIQSEISRVTGTIDREFSDVVMLTHVFATDVDLNRLMDAEYETPFDFLDVYQNQLGKTLDINPIYRQITFMTICTDNPTVLSGAGVLQMKELSYDFDESPVLLDVTPVDEDSSVLLRIATGKSLNRSELDVSVLRSLDYYPQYNNHQKLMRVSMNLTELSQRLADMELFDKLLLVDERNRVLLTSEAAPSLGSKLQYYSSTDLGRDQRVLESPLPSIPSLRLLGIYDTHMYDDAFRSTQLQYILLSLLVVALSMLLVLYLIRTITSRLTVINDSSRRIAKGEFTLMDPMEMGTDEVGTLAQAINEMCLQLQKHIDVEIQTKIKHSRLQREKARAELNALQSQVNPHFMFNAMEAIRLKAKGRGETETARMITYMARMFRRVLDWHEDLIPLNDELSFIHEFTSIQSYRYDDDFYFELDVDDELRETLIPKMFLQLLVENACVHGMASNSSAHRVALHIKREDGRMHITVQDDGEGIPEERLAELRKLLRNGDNSIGSVGLRNVKRRLELYYGDDYIFDVESEAGKGTTFLLVIPIRKSEGEFHVSPDDRG